MKIICLFKFLFFYCSRHERAGRELEVSREECKGLTVEVTRLRGRQDDLENQLEATRRENRAWEKEAKVL